MSSGDWLRRAQEFLEEAENAFQRGRYWFACFNAHQAAEFFLKGKLLEKCGSFTFTHDLAVLLQELCACLSLSAPSDIVIAAQFLSPHYTGSRYPGIRSVIYDRSLAQNCLNMARKIIGWADKL